MHMQHICLFREVQMLFEVVSTFVYICNCTLFCFFYHFFIILSIKCQETVKKIKIKCIVINPFRYIPSYKKHIFVFFYEGAGDF